MKMITDTIATQTITPTMQPTTAPATLDEPLLPVCPPRGTLGVAVIIPLFVLVEDDAELLLLLLVVELKGARRSKVLVDITMSLVVVTTVVAVSIMIEVPIKKFIIL